MQPSLVLFPTFGTLNESDTTWTINIHGTLYAPREIRLRKKIFVRWLRRAVGSADADFDNGLLSDRLRDFVAATARGQRVVVRADDHKLELVTRGNGHFAGELDVPADETKSALTVHAETDGGIRSQGEVQLVRGSGASVISDIDDTIKHTLVTQRREMLRNTFLREFRSIDGMAEVYRSWAEQSAMFHFVSGSVWQLYRPLRELFDREGFPSGSFHLRTLRVRRTILKRLLRMSRTSKLSQIRSIVAAFPRRRFMLVGDSGQQDPEIYAQIAREFPDQIDRIIIREVASLAETGRLSQLMDTTTEDIWQVFRDASELDRSLSPLSARSERSS